MKIIKPNPPQELKLHLPWDTLAELKLYQTYQKEQDSKWDLREMATEILTVFLAEGDPDFLRWRKQPKSKPILQTNGAQADA